MHIAHRQKKSITKAACCTQAYYRSPGHLHHTKLHKRSGRNNSNQMHHFDPIFSHLGTLLGPPALPLLSVLRPPASPCACARMAAAASRAARAATVFSSAASLPCAAAAGGGGGGGASCMSAATSGCSAATPQSSCPPAMAPSWKPT